MKPLFLFIISATLLACTTNNPNIGADGKDVIQSHLKYTDKNKQQYQDTVYIPIYSDIYSEHRLKWGADKDTKPLFQAVMVGTSGQHGLSFVVDGVSITDN